MSNLTDDLKRKAQQAQREAGPRAIRFMQGRNGNDSLGNASIGAAIITMILGWLFWIDLFNWLSLAFFGYALFRMLSRNITKRTNENLAWIRVSEKPRRWLNLQYQKIKHRKTACFFTCPNCNTNYSVPKGKGQVRARCPHCGQQHLHTT
ncbi:MAG: hypothetical protein Q4D06_05230 [Coriobacteriia bacterium]|nr:hypothetical protein [Coriobacteriia bacterium]